MLALWTFYGPLPARWQFLLPCLVPRFPRSLPYHAQEPIQLLPRRRHRNPSGSQPRGTDRRHNMRLGQPDIRPSLLHHRHQHRRRSPSIPIHIRQDPFHHGGRLFRTILRPRRLGRHPNPSNGVIPRIHPNLCRGHILPTRQPRLVGFLDHRIETRRALPTPSNRERGASLRVR